MPILVISLILFIRNFNKYSIESIKLRVENQAEARVSHRHKYEQTTIIDTEISDVSTIVLWWTPFLDDMAYTKTCGNVTCRFTGDRDYLNHAKTKVNSSNPDSSSKSLLLEITFIAQQLLSYYVHLNWHNRQCYSTVQTSMLAQYLCHAIHSIFGLYSTKNHQKIDHCSCTDRPWSGSI